MKERKHQCPGCGEVITTIIIQHTVLRSENYRPPYPILGKIYYDCVCGYKSFQWGNYF